MTCTGKECNCGKETCPDCQRCLEPPVYRVKLDYVADLPTAVNLVDLYGNQIFDLLPQIQAGETDTSLELDRENRKLDYFPEEYTRTEGKAGCRYSICIPDIAALIDLNELRNVNGTPSNGDVPMFDSTTNAYEMYNLAAALLGINQRIDATNTRIDNLEKTVNAMQQTINELNRRVLQLTETVGNINNRLTAIENAIYNWTDDKNTKIPRGTINITSGGYNSNNIIQSRAKDQDNDLDFS